MRYRVENTKTQCVIGNYTGDSTAEALEAHANDAGYSRHVDLVRASPDNAHLVATPVRDSHPNRSRAAAKYLPPTPETVRTAREYAGLTQTEAAEVVRGSLNAWQQWEAPLRSPANRRMHPGLFELFMLRTKLAAE